MNENALIEQILHGDTRCFAPLVDKYKDMVFALCMRMAKNREDAEDLTQEIFVKAYMSLDTFKKNSKFSTWLFRIAFNECASMKRMPALDTTPVEDWMAFDEEMMAPAVSTMQQMNNSDRLHYIQEALSRMKEKEALILTLFYLNEHSIQEIAYICGESEASVKVILHRGRTSMGKILTELLGAEAAASLI